MIRISAAVLTEAARRRAVLAAMTVAVAALTAGGVGAAVHASAASSGHQHTTAYRCEIRGGECVN